MIRHKLWVIPLSMVATTSINYCSNIPMSCLVMMKCSKCWICWPNFTTLVEQLAPEIVPTNVFSSDEKPADGAGAIRDLEPLLRQCRPMLSVRSWRINQCSAGGSAPQYCQSIYGNETVLPAIALDPAMEQLLLKSVQQTQKTDDIIHSLGWQNDCSRLRHHKKRDRR